MTLARSRAPTEESAAVALDCPGAFSRLAAPCGGLRHLHHRVACTQAGRRLAAEWRNEPPTGFPFHLDLTRRPRTAAQPFLPALMSEGLSFSPAVSVARGRVSCVSSAVCLMNMYLFGYRYRLSLLHVLSLSAHQAVSGVCVCVLCHCQADTAMWMLGTTPGVTRRPRPVRRPPTPQPPGNPNLIDSDSAQCDVRPAPIVHVHALRHGREHACNYQLPHYQQAKRARATRHTRHKLPLSCSIQLGS